MTKKKKKPWKKKLQGKEIKVSMKICEICKYE